MRASTVAGVLALLLALMGSEPARPEPVPEPDGYRMENYRAPVPAAITGGRTVTTEEAERLWRSGEAVFVDMLPRPERPSNLPAGTVWRDKARDDIPGSIWLPNTGHGALSAEMESYFALSLERATKGDRSMPLVFYCLADCWMSWNGARRAIALGYRTVHWYPDGTDGWTAAGLPLDPREPLEP